MKHGQAHELAGIVRKAIRSPGGDLRAQLANAGFDDPLSRCVTLAVCLTRLEPAMSFATYEDLDAAHLDAAHLDAANLDAAGVAIQFNIINRIATAYGLQPSTIWDRGWARPFAHRLLSIVFRSPPRAWYEPASPAGPSNQALDAILQRWAADEQTRIRDALEAVPHWRRVLDLQTNALASAELPEALRELVELATFAALFDDEAASDAADPPVDDDLSRACRDFAIRLTRQPRSVTKDDLRSLSRLGLNEAQVLDVVYHVSVLNGIGRWRFAFSREGPFRRICQ